MLLRRIVSGGQTGADRAALDVAIGMGLEHGGWVPLGRWAEDGPVPPEYKLVETLSSKVDQRTEWNVRDSDATLIIAPLPLTGGTKLTKELALSSQKPVLCIDPTAASVKSNAEAIVGWLSGLSGSVLNVAGPRPSEAPDIYQATYEIIAASIRKLKR